MKQRLYLVGLVISLAAFSLGVAFANGEVTTETKITIVGTITARCGEQITLRTDDGKVYTINTANSAVLLDKLPENSLNIRVGDRMRVYGDLVASDQINATRVHIFVSESEPVAVSPPVVIPPPSIPSGVGAGPSWEDVVQLPCPGDSLGLWRSRAIVIGINYANRTLTIGTSRGTFVIDASVATIVEANRTVPLASISQGDAIRVWGDIAGLNTIRADRIELTRSRNFQKAAMPLTQIASRGVIVSIDYTSFTITVNTETAFIRVLIDENTFIHFQGYRRAFQNLAVGQQVKVVGIGSLTTGFAASEIVIVGGPVKGPYEY